MPLPIYEIIKGKPVVSSNMDALPSSVIISKTGPSQQQMAERYYFRERKPKRRRVDDSEDDSERSAKLIQSSVAYASENNGESKFEFPLLIISVNQVRTLEKNLSAWVEEALILASLQRKDDSENAFVSYKKETKLINEIKIPKSCKEAVCYTV